MEWSLVIDTEPTVEPVTLAQAKEHLRITHSDEDAKINRLITAARKHAEYFTARAFNSQRWLLKLECWPNVIQLPNPPAAQIIQIDYVDPNGDTQTLSTSVYYVDYKQEPGTVRLAYGQSWPALRSLHNAVVVLYQCGYGTTADSVPADIREAILAIMATSYEFREDVTTSMVTRVPEAADRLLWPYRTWLEYPWR